MNKSLVSLALALTTVPTLAANAPAQLPEGIAACALIKDLVERATCYDREVAALSRTPAAEPALPASPAPAAPIPAPLPAPPSSPPRSAPSPSDFGKDSLPNRSIPDEEQAASVLRARVTAVRQHNIGGIRTITLDNGQVWRQKEARRSFAIAAGDSVSIEKGKFGGYHLSRDSDREKNWIYVSRLR